MCDMADNGSVQEKGDGVTLQEGNKDPPRDETQGAGAVNVVRVDELQGAITDLMKKAWGSLPPLVGAGVRPPAQGKNDLTSPVWDDRPSLPPCEWGGHI